MLNRIAIVLPPFSLPVNNQLFLLCGDRHNRKNWLHLGNDRGGQTAAVLMSLVQSCRGLGVELLGYLRDGRERVSTHPASRITELLPDAWRPPPS
jgi:hypothetical protein